MSLVFNYLRQVIAAGSLGRSFFKRSASSFGPSLKRGGLGEDADELRKKCEQNMTRLTDENHALAETILTTELMMKDMDKHTPQHDHWEQYRRELTVENHVLAKELLSAKSLMKKMEEQREEHNKWAEYRRQMGYLDARQNKHILDD